MVESRNGYIYIYTLRNFYLVLCVYLSNIMIKRISFNTEFHTIFYFKGIVCIAQVRGIALSHWVLKSSLQDR